MVLGIDPGKDGALVLLDGPVVQLAVLTSGLLVGKDYAPERMVECLRMFVTISSLGGIANVVLELPGVRPGEGRGGGLTTGKGWGIWRGIVAALGLPCITPAASSWTRVILRDAPGEGKDRAIHVALSRLPGIDLTPGRRVKPHSGIADAACLALYGQTKGSK